MTSKNTLPLTQANFDVVQLEARSLALRLSELERQVSIMKRTKQNKLYISEAE